MMPYIVALTGGIASGKSTITDLFSKLGVPIVDADVVARTVVEKGKPALNGIVNHFGDVILLPSGELDRRKLRQCIFNDEQERIWLNQFLHPVIEKESIQLIQQSQNCYVIWVVPLLIENNLYKKADRVLVVNTTEDIQLKRLQKRDNINQYLAKKMLLSQVSNKERVSYADDIIVNNGEISELSQQVTQLHHQYIMLSENSQKK